jgi:hypothetical protein
VQISRVAVNIEREEGKWAALTKKLGLKIE